jgi:hypothetical protein
MTELKTLKDIEGSDIEIGVDENVVGVVELKHEAIKWIKHIQEDIKQVRELQGRALLEESLLGRVAVNGLDECLESQIQWIKDFFNITDEDLK